MSGTIVINEFLTFVQNKIDVIDELSIVQICASNFTDSEIEIGKQELCNSLACEGVKYTQRKGEDKNKKNIKDVIKAFKESEPTKQPTYVAKNLNRLPPVTFDHIDVTRLLKDIVFLKSELQSLRNDAVSKTEISDWQSKISSDISSLCKCKCTCEKKPAEENKPKRPKHKNDIPAASSKQTASSDNGNSNVLVRELRKEVNATGRRERANSTETLVCTPPSYRDIMLMRQPTRSNINHNDEFNKDENDFTQVTNKKRARNTNMHGSALSSGKLQVADLPGAVYLSRLSKSTSVDDVKDYIKTMGEDCIDVLLLPQKHDLDFNSFKVVVPRRNLNIFLKK